MLVAIGRNSLANNDAGIADRFRDREHAEIALGKVAEGIEIKYLAARVKESMLGVVAHGRGTDDHAGGVGPAGSDAVGGAGGAAERS